MTNADHAPQNLFETTFGKRIYVGNNIKTPANDEGIFYRATVEDDEDSNREGPISMSDGHGPTRETTYDRYNEPQKRAGERIIWQENGSMLLYDFAAAVKIARADWGTKSRKDAARWAERDFETLRAFYADQWSYVGVVLSKHQVNEEGDEVKLDDYIGSLWGIGSNDSSEYLTEVANDLAREAMAEDAAKPKYSAPYGSRSIYRNGSPFIVIGRAEGDENGAGRPSPVDVDEVSAQILALLQKANA